MITKTNDANVSAQEGINLINFLAEANYNVSESSNKKSNNLVTSSYDENSQELKRLISNLTDEDILNLTSYELRKFLENLKRSSINYIDSNQALINKLK